MMIKTNNQMSFSEGYVQKRTRKSTFFKHIKTIVDWKLIEKEIRKVYKKGFSVDGRPSYPGLLLFKMLLLQHWYSLSDMGVEDMVNENLSAMVFCGLQLEDEVPDHSTVSRFRKELTARKVFDRLLRKLNNQLESKRIIVESGVRVDASITDSPRRPKGKTTYEICEDRREDQRDEADVQAESSIMKVVKVTKPGVDTEARWLKKAGKLHYGYKKHIAVDESGMVLSVHTTTANEHDSKGLTPLLKKTPKKHLTQGAYTDKGYKVPDNDELLKELKTKNRIQYKAYRNRPLSHWQKEFNRLISKERYKVERTFGSMKRWFGAGQARYIGLAKTHTQHVLEAIAYNLYRTPGIIMSGTG
jgi:transposase, IS5 family